MTELPAWQTAADATRRLGHRVEFHHSLPSTNDRARELLAQSGGEGVAVVADLQTSGRGRQGRSWSSPAGRNLMVSVGLRPRIEARMAGLLSLVPALAVTDAAEASGAGHLGIRWPNDVVTAGGLKVAGILVEAATEDGQLREAVIGMGINVNWPRSQMPPEIAGRATSLCDLAGGDVDRALLLGEVLAALDREMARLEAGENPVGRLRERSVLDGRRLRVDLGAEVLEGTAAGLADDGALLVDASAGRVAVSSGEVVSVRDEPRAVPA